jgi:lipoprotein-anchoring transpeptidase ErfK/SrfK
VWHSVFQAVAKGQDNPHGYSFAVASKASPETLTVWHEGRVVMHGIANTGISVSPTVDGTFPVYLRYRYQVMRGQNPDGSKYADPVEFVSYFNGGDAVHSYYRPSYGYPQSLGCVELPLDEAAQVWPYLTYGSLVTVTG